MIYLMYLIAAVIIIGRIVQIQLTYEPDPRIANLFKPKSYKKALYPDRGSILARDGRLLAMSLPMYRVYMDCTVRKREFEELKNSDSPKHRRRKEVERKGQGTGRRPCQA